MQKVTVNGIMYLGKLKNKNGMLTLKNAMPVGAIDKATIAEYLKRKNTGDLGKPEKFAGNGISWSVGELTDQQEMELQMCKLAMKQAKRIAAAGTENSVFDGILGNL